MLSASQSLEGGRVPRIVPWLAFLASALLLAAAMPYAGLSVNPTGHLELVAMLTTAAILVTKADRHGKLWPRRLANLVEILAIFLGLTLAGLLASYTLSTWTRPYCDAFLAALDARLGFDWLGAYRLTQGSPALQWVGRWSYQCIGATPIVLIAGLVLAGREDHARRFLMAFWLALVVTMAFYPFFPAVGPLTWLAGGDMSYAPTSGIQHTAVIAAARARSLGEIDPATMIGMVTFPSFHAAAAVLFAWFGSRLRRLRWPLFAVNAAMLAATPVEGNHYLVDVLAGVLVAAFAIWASHPRHLRHIRPRRARAFRQVAPAASA